MNLDQALQTFIAECRELLADMETALLGVEQADEKEEMVNAIFRAAHTIKGSAGLFNLDHLVAFTHVVESVLDQVRDGKRVIADELLTLLLSCCDHLSTLVEALAAGQTEPDSDLQQLGDPLLARLHVYLAAPVVTAAAAAAAADDDDDAVKALLPGSVLTVPTAQLSPFVLSAGWRAQAAHWHLSLRFSPEVLKTGMDPLSFIRYLRKIGQVVGILTLSDDLPDAESMDPELCYLGFEIALQTSVDQAKIEDVFEFVRDDCRLRILPPHSLISDYIGLIEPPAEAARLGQRLVLCGSLTAHELAQWIEAQAIEARAQTDARAGAALAPTAASLVDEGEGPPGGVDAGRVKRKQVRDFGAQESRSIRIDADKLDQLIDLVGELIIAGANVNLIARRSQIGALMESTGKLSTLVEEVRDSALQLRMVKIGATFGRFQRVVHDVSRDLGKDIALLINGEDTELDKTVVEKIGDPLMHLVRNAMDHGIEPADLRVARGKPAQGTLSLNAFHDSGSIVITVQDDGGGLQRDRILAKAVERGLVDAGQALSDGEVYALIFEPGFSTAEQVTSLSGRGVGMDVVKRNITALRGTVEVTSQLGVGTMVTVRLPLTLAIIAGFLVGVGKTVYAIPLDMIEECIAYSAEPGHDYTNLRGELLPFIRLRQLFSVPGAPARGENIVVLKHAAQKAGLVVDTLLGEFQTVIKPLDPMFGQVQCISGSTILGSGDVALILDIPALIRQAVQSVPARRGEPLPA